MHGGALVSLIPLQLNLELKLLACVIIVFNASKTILNQIHIHKHPLSGKYIDHDKITEKIGQQFVSFADISSSSHSYPFFVILRVVIRKNETVFMVIFADSLIDYHRLRIRIRHLQRSKEALPQ